MTPTLMNPTVVTAPLAAATRSVANVAADAAATIVSAADAAQHATRSAITAVAGERSACALLGCTHGDTKTLASGRLLYRSCSWCGATSWDDAA